MVIGVSFLFLTVYSAKESSAEESVVIEETVLGSAHGDQFTLSGKPTVSQYEAEIVASDGRSKLVDNFFARYNSPMVGLGQDIVEAADRHQIPFGILPAIAQCEGNLGKKMPAGSFNPYGFGIYGDLVTKFSSWQEGIEIVSRTLRREYFDVGLDTPETIMRKYTPPSTGSWAFCVTKFLEELK